MTNASEVDSRFVGATEMARGRAMACLWVAIVRGLMPPRDGPYGTRP